MGVVGDDGQWSVHPQDLWDAEGLAALLDRSTDILVVLDASGAIRYANAAGQALLGHPEGALLGVDAFSLVHPDDRGEAARRFGDALASPEPIGPIALRLVDHRGELRHTEVVASNLLANPAVAGVIVNIRDVTDRVAATQALEASEARFRQLAESAPDLIFRWRVSPVRAFEYVSPAALALTGYTAEELRDRPELVASIIAPDVLAQLGATDWTSGDVRPAEFEIVRRDGSLAFVQLRVSVHTDDGGGVLAIDGIVRDLSERRAAEQALLHRALHDPLTGLPNRVLFYDRLEHALHRSDRLPSSPAVLFLDLDGFKPVNDRLGHAAGDELLVAVARRLQACVRPSDTIARLGGDEFLVLCDDLGDDLQLDSICDRLRGALVPPIEVDGHPEQVGVSIGAVRAGEDATADELLRLADEAMYRDKQGHTP